MKKLLLILTGALLVLPVAGQEDEGRKDFRQHISPGFLQGTGEYPDRYPVLPDGTPSRVLKRTQNQMVLDSLTEYRWSDASQSHELNYRAYYEYNGAGRIVEWKDVDWNSDQGAWEADDRETYTYNEDGKLQLYVFYEQDSPDEAWWGSWKREYFYENGRLSETVDSQKNNKGESYYLTWKRVYLYDDMDRIAGTREYIHTFFWSETWRTENTYDENGNLVTITDYDDSDTNPGSWENAVRIDYEYDEKDRLILYERYEWDEESEQWLPDDREEYSFLPNDDLDTFVDFDWDETGNNWEFSWKGEYTYDTDFSYEQLVLPWFFHDDRPNFMNHLMSEFHTYLYDGDSWDNYYRGEYHFSASGPVGLSATATGNGLSVYPNPADNEVRIVWSEEGKYQLEMYDLTGKRVESRWIESRQPVDISRLERGIYLFRITGEGKENTRSTRVIVE